MSLQIGVHVKDLTIGAQVRQTLEKDGLSIHMITTPARQTELLEALHLLVVDEEADDVADEALSEFRRKKPALFLQTSTDARRTTRALRQGYRECLLIPDDLLLLQEAVIRWTKVRDSASSGQGVQMIALYSITGGSGRTTLSAHTSLALASLGLRTLAVDLSLGFGTLRQTFGFDGTSSLADLLPVLHELNENHLRNAVDTLQPNLDLLAAPNTDVSDVLTEHEVRQLLDAFVPRYDAMVLDLPVQLNGLTQASFDLADVIVYVLEPTTTGLWALGSLLSRLDPTQLPREKLQVVVNSRSPRLVSMGGVDVRKLYWLPILGEVGFDTNAPVQGVLKAWEDSTNLGGIARDMRRLVEPLAGEARRSTSVAVTAQRRGLASLWRGGQKGR